MSGGTALTLGGAVIGLGLLARVLILWWPGVKRARKNPSLAVSALVFGIILPYCFGTLLAMCAGGLVGWVLDWGMWGSNWAGDAGLVWGVGGQAGDVVSSRGPSQLLTNGGHAFVLVSVFVFAAVCRRYPQSRPVLLQSAWAGTMLGMVPGVLGVLAIPCATAANLSMAWLTTTTLT